MRVEARSAGLFCLARWFWKALRKTQDLASRCCRSVCCGCRSRFLLGVVQGGTCQGDPGFCRCWGQAGQMWVNVNSLLPAHTPKGELLQNGTRSRIFGKRRDTAKGSPEEGAGLQERSKIFTLCRNSSVVCVALALLLDAQLRGATPDLAVGLVDMCRLWDGPVHCWRNPAGPTALAGVGDVTLPLAPAADNARCQLVTGLVLDLTAQHRLDRAAAAATTNEPERARIIPQFQVALPRHSAS